MDNYIVYFEYYSEGESGNDKYRFTSKTEALEQMAELKQAIKVNFCDSTETETIEALSAPSALIRQKLAAPFILGHSHYFLVERFALYPKSVIRVYLRM